MKRFLILSILTIFIIPLMAQEIISLPITEKDKTIEWNKKEKQYFSEIWQTEVVTNVIKPTMQVFDRPQKKIQAHL